MGNHCFVLLSATVLSIIYTVLFLFSALGRSVLFVFALCSVIVCCCCCCCFCFVVFEFCLFMFCFLFVCLSVCLSLSLSLSLSAIKPTVSNALFYSLSTGLIGYAIGLFWCSVTAWMSWRIAAGTAQLLQRRTAGLSRRSPQRRNQLRQNGVTNYGKTT